MKNKPSDFTNYPWSSIFSNAESEIVALNIMKILKRTGDTFRELSEEEYTIARQKDGNFSERELSIFKKVLPYCTAEKAPLFSSDWR